MRIIELTELQFHNYSDRHSRKSFRQSVEYARLKQLSGYTPHYLGLVDDDDQVHAATLLLEKPLNNKHRSGYMPNGYLINFFNIDLLQTFTSELKIYLKKDNYIYVRINPLIYYQIYDSDFILKENNSRIIDEFKKLGYSFIPNTAKYKMILKATDIQSTYQNFKRSLRRTINDCLKKGIVVYQIDSEQEREDFFSMIENRERYERMLDTFNQPNNKMICYLAKINPNTYINNYRYLLKKEQINNEMLNDKLKDPNVQKSTKLVEKKIISDKTIDSYNNEIIRGTSIARKYPNGVVISGVAVIATDKEVTFVKECFSNEFKDIKSIPLVKWEIMKQFISQGYHTFDLGDVVITKNQITKTGYNGSIIEYSNTFDLVINDLLYKLNGFAKKHHKKETTDS